MLGLVAGTAAAGEGTVTEHIEYYTVRGSSVAELGGALARSGPIGGVVERRGSGHTVAQLTWQHTAYAHERECRLDEVQVAVATRTLLPHWEQPKRVDRGLVHRWDRMLEALTRHEARHRELGREAAVAVLQALREVTTASDCDKLRRRIDGVARRIVRRFREANRRFDRDTDFGIRDGVRLDP
ncbi:MAG: DUF922 domain-containing protein [Xanthomonadales bacterium]|nr:DUF922 domain-containing protein [Xanthomonadales bacterium]